MNYTESRRVYPPAYLAILPVGAGDWLTGSVQRIALYGRQHAAQKGGVLRGAEPCQSVIRQIARK